jgi:hypothetical protein
VVEPTQSRSSDKEGCKVLRILSNAIGNIIHFLSLEVIIQVAQGLDTKSATFGGRGRGKAHPPVRNPSPRTENLALFGE